MSPWVTFRQDYSSFVENRTHLKDWVHCDGLLFLADMLKPTITLDTAPFFQPLNAPNDWWNGLSKVSKRVLNTVGEVECMRDPIISFYENVLKVHIKDSQAIVEENGTHIDMLIDFGCGEGGHSKSYEAVVSWLVESFTT